MCVFYYSVYADALLCYQQGRIDYGTFCHAASVRHFASMLGSIQMQAPQIRKSLIPKWDNVYNNQ